MRIFAPDKSELLQVSALERDGNHLVMKGKVMGALPMTARLSPEEARQGLKLLNFRLVLFLLTFLFRKG
jgi:hypothetical protein